MSFVFPSVIDPAEGSPALTGLIRHARGPLVSIAVLGISATAVFAAGSLPLQAGPGLATASAAAGKTVPVRAGQQVTADATASSTATPTATPSPTPTPMPSPSPVVTAASLTLDGDNHGSLVSVAAQMPTPSGFPNHGAFVSCVAKLNHGQWGGGQPATPVVLGTLTPEQCEALEAEAAAAKATARAAQASARASAKAERAAAREARRQGASGG